MRYDAVFVGAGHNGLAAAALLAKQGWSVGVFERNPVAGGAVQTRELTLPGFRHDFGAMNLSLFAGSPFHQQHAAELAGHGLAFAPATNCFCSAFPDGTWLGVSTDLDATASAIGAFSTKDAETWRTLAAAFGADAPHIFSLLGSPMTPWSLAKNGWKSWRAMGKDWVYDTVRLLMSSPRTWLDEKFESDKVRATLAAWGMHLDFPPDMAGGALFPYLEAMANQSFGMVIGKGGADTMIMALTAMVKANGGEVHTDAEVAEISISGGAATGIKLADGRSVSANKAVIANLAPAVLGRLMPGGTGNAAYDRGMDSFRHAPGTMMIHLAMDDLPTWSAGDALRDFAYVHLAPSYRVMADAYTQAKAGLLPVEPVLVVGQPTAIDPSRAPEGKHVLWIQVRVVPGAIEGDAAGEITDTKWSAVKEVYADRAMAILEWYAPGSAAKVLHRTVHSPLDLERENPNLIGGDQIGGSHHLSQNFLFRPITGWANWNTPIDNLHLVGASTWPGAGVGAGSGTMLAKKLGG